MVKITVDEDLCTGCGTCVENCPSEVYEIVDNVSKVVNPEECIECLACEEQCPEEAITVEED
ncbi:MAG: 4Fe-4S dicluster domain-containing protein [Candidatus Lokiarchaeota archaeon]|nr:4Fe-4S dicluster domain-containing protein [Candidatus Lokiarchaeota archaeon]